MGTPAPPPWDSVAEAYYRQSEHAFQAGSAIGEWLCDAAGVGPGTRVLDIAAGPAQTTLIAARRGAQVICTDLSDGMLGVARRVLAEAGFDDVEVRRMDALDMDLPDDDVDAIVCRFGIMLMPDPERVLSEARRVLRSGGAMAYGVWSAEDSNQWVTLIRRAVEAAGLPLPPPVTGPGTMFSLADPADNEAIARAAGFTDVTHTTIDLPFRFASVEDFWRMRLEGSPGTQELFAPFSDEQIASVRAALDDLAAPFVGDGGEVVFPTRTLAVRVA